MSEDSDVAFVVGELGKHVDPGQIMLVGARCRDIHQRRFQPHPAARTTEDMDFALALHSWDDFAVLRRVFPSKSKVWQRVEIGALPIDLIPFGPIEDPPGEIKSKDGHVLNVAGFREVFDDAHSHSVADGIAVQLPSVPGFTALKLHAWLDRKVHRKYKDASDLALILSWYEESQELWDRFFELQDDAYLGQPDAMAAEVLGFDVARVLGEREARALLGRFSHETADGIELFAEKLVVAGEHEHPLERRAVQVGALLRGLGLLIG